MKDHPIIFSTEMVKAILAGRKTQTRRIVSRYNSSCSTHHLSWLNWDKLYDNNPFGLKACSKIDDTIHRVCPKWQKDDLLWVREAFSNYRGFAKELKPDAPLIFRADKDICGQYPCSFGNAVVYVNQREPWKPSIHMPKSSARIWLMIKNAWVDRLQYMGPTEAIAEGIECTGEIMGESYYGNYGKDDIGDKLRPYDSFRTLWESIHGSESWDANPWVWVIEFERIEQPSIQ